jgi:hypothetical protein
MEADFLEELIDRLIGLQEPTINAPRVPVDDDASEIENDRLWTR